MWRFWKRRQGEVTGALATARRLGISHPTLQSWIAKGIITGERSVSPGGRVSWRFEAREIERVKKSLPRK